MFGAGRLKAPFAWRYLKSSDPSDWILGIGTRKCDAPVEVLDPHMSITKPGPRLSPALPRHKHAHELSSEEEFLHARDTLNSPESRPYLSRKVHTLRLDLD